MLSTLVELNNLCNKHNMKGKINLTAELRETGVVHLAREAGKGAATKGWLKTARSAVMVAKLITQTVQDKDTIQIWRELLQADRHEVSLIPAKLYLSPGETPTFHQLSDRCRKVRYMLVRFAITVLIARLGAR